MRALLRKIFRLCMMFHGFGSLGSNSGVIPFGTKIWNKSRIYIGDNSTIGARSSLLVSTSYNQQIFDPKVVIGNNVSIGNGLFLSCIDSIIIEDSVLFSDEVFISDHIHGYQDINTPILSQNLEKKGPVYIKSGAFVGIRAIIHPGVTVGRNSVVGAAAVVISDVPDYSVVVGNPAKVVKRYDFDAKTWINV